MAFRVVPVVVSKDAVCKALDQEVPLFKVFTVLARQAVVVHPPLATRTERQFPPSWAPACGLRIVDFQLDHVPDQFIDHGDRRLTYGGQGGGGPLLARLRNQRTASPTGRPNTRPGATPTRPPRTRPSGPDTIASRGASVRKRNSEVTTPPPTAPPIAEDTANEKTDAMPRHALTAAAMAPPRPAALPNPKIATSANWVIVIWPSLYS